MALKWIEIVHKQLKQTIVLLIEMLKFEMEKDTIKTNEGTNNIQTNKAFLLQQALIIS